jgi:hypothetical protein
MNLWFEFGSLEREKRTSTCGVSHLPGKAGVVRMGPGQPREAPRWRALKSGPDSVGVKFPHLSQVP